MVVVSGFGIEGVAVFVMVEVVVAALILVRVVVAIMAVMVVLMAIETVLKRLILTVAMKLTLVRKSIYDIELKIIFQIITK